MLRSTIPSGVRTSGGTRQVIARPGPKVHEASFRRSESHDGDDPVRLLHVGSEARRGRDDPPPCLVSLDAGEGFGAHLQAAAVDLDPDMVRVVGEVEIPTGVASRAQGCRGHQPGPRPGVLEPREERPPTLAGPGTDRFQQEEGTPCICSRLPNRR